MTSGQLPNLIIVGASRSGTSSLHYYLQEHPDIFMSKPKELRFFDIDSNYNKGLEYYSKFFGNASRNQVKGESSPTYFDKGITFKKSQKYKYDAHDDDCALRINKCLPNVKIIISLRNPVTRLYSQYVKNLKDGRETQTILKRAIEEELNGFRRPENTPLCWLYKNKYSVHLERWFELFPPENIKVLIFEEWVKDTKGTLCDLCDFLNVGQNFSFTRIYERKNRKTEPRSYLLNKVKNKTFGKTKIGEIIDPFNLRVSTSKISETDYAYIYSALENDIAQVEKLLNRNLGIWKM